MSIDRVGSSTPLVVTIADQPDRTGSENALLFEPDMASYDPETQTSTVPTYAGNHAATYAHTGTGTALCRDIDRVRGD